MSALFWFAMGFFSCAGFVAFSVTLGFYVCRTWWRDARQGYDPY